jgi:hypothetical protein
MQKRPIVSTLKGSKYLRMDSIVAFAILISPIFFYLYLCFPDVKIWKTYFFTYNSHYYNSVYVLMWTFLQKFMFFYLMLIWYFTTKNWWNKIILLPIGMLFYQLVFIFREDIRTRDEGELEIFFVLFSAIFFCTILIFIRKKLSFYIDAIELKEAVEIEIEKVRNELKNA